MTTLRHLTIERKTWVRSRNASTALLTWENCRCCLGFAGRACGVPDDINDTALDGDATRERLLTALFAAHGTELHFVDDIGAGTTWEAVLCPERIAGVHAAMTALAAMRGGA